MSDQPTESVVESAEPQALPAPVVSPPSQTQPSAAPDLSEQLTRLKTDLLTELKTYVDRSSQSVKDRRIVGLERKIEELSAAKIVLDAHGGDVNKAAREAAIDEILGSRESPANQGKVGEDWDADVQSILSEAEQSAGVKVPLNDPDLRAAVMNADGTPKRFASYSAALNAVNRVVLRKARGIPAGIVPTEVAGTAANLPNVDALTNNLQALIASGAPTGQIVEAREKLLAAMK